MSHRRRFAALLLVAAATAACGEATGPPVAGFDPVDYLMEVVDVMEAHHLHRLTIDWTAFRDEVYVAGRAARSIPETFPAIGLALRMLGDRGHSYYRATNGLVHRALRPDCEAPAVERPALPEGIGYVRVPSSGGGSSTAAAYARALQDSIRSNDAQDLAGWIVDVRGNGGGSMWAMVAGVGPVLGEGVAGRFIYPDGRDRPWSYEAGASMLEAQVVTQVDEPYELLAPSPRVAVLTDGAVSSAGEAVVQAFRARPDARSFGQPTCGLAMGLAGYSLSDGALLALAVAWTADRDGHIFEREIPPDETIEDAHAVVQRAVEWLTTDDA